MSDYILAAAFWFVASLAAAFVLGGLGFNIYAVIMIFSLVAAVATVAYEKAHPKESQTWKNVFRNWKNLRNMIMYANKNLILQ